MKNSTMILKIAIKNCTTQLQHVYNNIKANVAK